MLCFLDQAWTCVSHSVVLWELSQWEIGKYYIRLPKALTVQANISTLSSVIWQIPPKGFAFIKQCATCVQTESIIFFPRFLSFFFLYILSWQFLTSNSQFNRLPTHVPLGVEENGTQSLQSVSLWNTFRNIRTLDCLFNILYNFTYNLYKCLIIYLWNIKSFKVKVCLYFII